MSCRVYPRRPVVRPVSVAAATGGPNPFIAQFEGLDVDGKSALEELQKHDSEKVYVAALNLLRLYFEEEDEPVDAHANFPAADETDKPEAAHVEKLAQDGPESDADDADAADMMFSFGGGEVNANPFG